MFRKRKRMPHLTLDEDEARLLRQVITEYEQLLDADRALDDPVMARLFPSASLDDAEVERTFRDMVQTDLEAHKRATIASARQVLGADGPVEQTITPELSSAWLALLTDLRLAIGVRLAVDEESMTAYPDPRDPEQWPLAVMHYLGALQESLVDVAPLDAP